MIRNVSHDSFDSFFVLWKSPLLSLTLPTCFATALSEEHSFSAENQRRKGSELDGEITRA